MEDNEVIPGLAPSPVSALHGAVGERSMVERVARAMATADGCDPDDPAYVRYPGGTAFGLCWRDKYAAKARAAIGAMREPTEMMNRTGLARRQRCVGSAPIWRAMIDAALSDGPM